jgi:hypothetical protein
LRSLKTFIQNLAPSVCSIHRPEDLARAVWQHRECQINRLAADRRLVANLYPERIEEHDWIHTLERPALPGGYLGDDPVGYRADQIGRYLHRVHVSEEALNLPHGHPTCVEGEDLVVKPREAALVFRNQARLERAVAIARHLNRQRAVVGQHRFPARAVCGDWWCPPA